MAPEQKELRLIYGIVAGVSSLLLLAGWITQPAPIFLSLLYGVVIGAGNLVLLVWIVTQLTSGKTIKKRKIFISFGLKGLLFVSLIILILGKTHVSPVPLLLGMSNTVVGILLYGIYGIKDYYA